MQRGEINSFCLKGLQGGLFWEDTARLQVGQEEERTVEELETIKSLLVYLYSKEQSGRVWEGGERWKIASA